MQRVSDIIGKVVITLQGGSRAGTALDVFFDAQMEKCRIISIIGEDDELYWTDYKSILHTAGDALVIKSPLDVLPFPPPPYIKSPINLPAYNQDGQFLGIIRDLLLDGDRVAGFDAKAEIPAAALISHSDSAAVFNDSGVPIKIKKPAPNKRVSQEEQAGQSERQNEQQNVRRKSKKTPAQETPAILDNSLIISADNLLENPTNNSKENTVNDLTDNSTDNYKDGYVISTKSREKNDPDGKNQEKSAVGLPFKLPLQNIMLLPASILNAAASGNKYAFLLGKKVLRPVFSLSGQVIAGKGQAITDDIISRAKKEGRLIALAQSSR